MGGVNYYDYVHSYRFKVGAVLKNEMEKTLEAVVEELRNREDPVAKEGMARYGIRTDHAFGGSSLPYLRKMAKRLGTDHDLASALWSTGIHEARMLASLVEDPEQVNEEQMEMWAQEFDSWDICDQCCSNVFSYTPLGWKKALEWSDRKEEFVKRAGFALMAALAVHDKKATDDRFAPFFVAIEREASDPRNYVRKAVNWALRQIGKRNRTLNEAAIATAEKIKEGGSKAGRWVSADALRELRSAAVQERLAQRK